MEIGKIGFLKIVLLTLIVPAVTLVASGATVSLAAFNFDDGFQGWEPQSVPHFEWTVENIDDVSQGKGFSSIDPSDVSSLFMIVPSTGDIKTHCHITSPEIYIDEKSWLDFYVAYSSFYDDFCRLQLLVSKDNFKTSDILWKSNYDYNSSWKWIPINVDLADFAGEDVKFRFLYTTGSYKNYEDKGGYLGDFAIDNFFVCAEKEIREPDPDDTPSQPDDKPGNPEEDPSDSGDSPSDPDDKPSDPGDKPSDPSDKPDNPSGDPSDSDDPNSGPTEDPTDPSDKPNSLKAKILFPTSFRALPDFHPTVPPGTPVTFKDISAGEPLLSTWTFSGIDEDPLYEVTIREINPTVEFNHTGNQKVTLIVQNETGVDFTEGYIYVAYEGDVLNILSFDRAGTAKLDNGDTFTGSNSSGISAYAEAFQAPPAPALISGAWIYLTQVEIKNNIDGLSSIGIHLYSERNGVPNLKLASSYIMASQLPELNTADGIKPVYFQFEKPVVVDGNFFIVADGFPPSANGTKVTFAASDDSTGRLSSLIKVRNEWMEPREVIGDLYKNVAFLIAPHIGYSVFKTDPEQTTLYKVGKEPGEISITLFSSLPLLFVSSDCDWLSFSTSHSGFTRTATISYEGLPSGMGAREGSLTFGDGLETMKIDVIQEVPASIQTINEDTAISIFTIDGRIVFNGISSKCPPLPKGIYIVKEGERLEKIIL